MKRGFIDAGGRLVHYRRGGRGPALVMLHGSPNSSLKLAPLIEAFAANFDCIALDTPGNGLSEPLAADAPSAGDYAEALRETVDAAGLGRFCLYGFHTGAGTAAEFAGRWPERVASLVLDGAAAWTPDEQTGMLAGYLPEFRPSFDGAHLAWVWARFVEQAVYFPWHRPSAATRMDFDLHPPAAIHETVMEFLAAGDHYRKPYAAAFAGDGAARIRKLRVPTLATAHPDDPVAHHLERVGAVDPCVEIRRARETDIGEIRRGFLEFLRPRAGEAAPALFDPPRRGYVASGAGLNSYRAVAGPGRPLLLLHEAGGSSRSFAPHLAALDGVRPVLALDLPGHGDSDPAGLAGIEAFAAAAAGAAAALGLEDVDAVGRHFGGAVAVALKASGAARSAAILGSAVFTDDERASLRGKRVPDLAPRWDGAHLLTAWRYLRHAAFFDPWFERRRDCAVAGEPALDADALNRRCVDLLKSFPHHQAAFDAELAFALAARMGAADVRRIFLEPGDPMSGPRRRESLRSALGGRADFRDIGEAPGAIVAALGSLDP